MKTSTQRRIARFPGLLLLALLVVALAVPAAQAMRDFSTGTGGSSTSAGSGTSNAQQLPTLAQVQQHQGVGSSTSAGSGTSNAAQRQIGSAWGYYYSPAGRTAIAQRQTGFAWGYYSGVSTINVRQLHALLQGSTLAQVPQHQGAAAITSAGSGTNTASSGTSSTTVWIAVVAVLGAALVGAWALTRRRRRHGEEAQDCELSAAGC